MPRRLPFAGVLIGAFLLVGFIVGIGFLYYTDSEEKTRQKFTALDETDSSRTSQQQSPTPPKTQPDVSHSAVPQRTVQADSQTHLITAEQVISHSLISSNPNQLASPIRMAISGDRLYFLAQGQLYTTSLKSVLNARSSLQVESLMPNQAYRLPTGERIRELLDLSLTAAQDLILLDKSNDLYSYQPDSHSWRFALKARPAQVQPDPHYIALNTWRDKTYLLDYARNQIQRLSNGQASPYFSKEVMSWQLKPGDHNVTDAIDLHVDGDVYTLHREGRISRFRKGQPEARPFFEMRNLALQRHLSGLRVQKVFEPALSV